MNRIYIIILLAITFTSCFDENSFVIKPIPIGEGSIEVKVPYSMYEDQTYFNLNNSTLISHNNYADWDLGFEASPTGYHIIINTAKFMYAGNSNLTDFTSVTTTAVDTMMYDRSSGNLDSTAIGNWADYSDALNPIYPKKIYIIDRGVDENGTSLGYKKIVFEKLENDTYYIHYANLDNSDEHDYQVPKNALVNFVQFSFNGGGNLNVQQPNKDLWDFNLTKYSTVLFDNANHNKPTPYLVRGVLINKGISVALDSITPFTSISYSNVGSYTYSTKLDAIGWNWKIYKNDIYIVVDHYTYIIKDNNNNYFKLRFTDFYNKSGIKGYPTFEMSKLNI